MGKRYRRNAHETVVGITQGEQDNRCPTSNNVVIFFPHNSIMRLNNKTKVYGGSLIGLILVYLGYLKVQAKKKEGYKKHGCGSCSA